MADLRQVYLKREELGSVALPVDFEWYVPDATMQFTLRHENKPETVIPRPVLDRLVIPADDIDATETRCEIWLNNGVMKSFMAILRIIDNLPSKTTGKGCPVAFRDITCAEFAEIVNRVGLPEEFMWMRDFASVTCNLPSKTLPPPDEPALPQT